MNSKIEHARECALAILKPSKKDLEHGLELHGNSIVFDSYGFSPTSPLDGDIIKKAIEDGASPNELKDLREEMGMTRHVNNPELYNEYKEAWEASGVTCVFQNAGEESNAPMQIIKRFARFTYVADMLKGFLNRAVLPEDVERTRKEDRHCLYFTANGVPMYQRWDSAEEELGYIRLFFQLGCRMMHMTYNRRNLIGDGCAETANAGLSNFGEMVVKEMNRVGVICDVAHTGWKTSCDVAGISSGPVVSSHSVCCAVNQHFRGKPDDVIKAIVESGGYNGICCVPSFLGGNGDINALLDHIDYMIRKFGPDSVAIGTDNGYSSVKAPEEMKKFAGLLPKRGRNIWEQYWPENSFPGNYTEEAQKSLSWTNWPLFTVGLVQRGHSDDDIRKVIGGNVMRVIKAVLKKS